MIRLARALLRRFSDFLDQYEIPVDWTHDDDPRETR